MITSKDAIDNNNTMTLINNITTLLEYLWHDERKHYYEENCPSDHIFITLKRLRDEFELSELFIDNYLDE